jgi:alpha-mannosidase
MAYANPLAKKLELGVDDVKQEGKLQRLLADLAQHILKPVPFALAWRYSESISGIDEALGADWRNWPEFGPRTVWGRDQAHTFFAAEFVIPEEAAGKTFLLRFTSGWQDRLGSTDPQCLAYLDGKPVQAIDGNHNELVIARDAVPGTRHTLIVNAFTFFPRPLTGFLVEGMVRNEQVEALWFDLSTPFDVATRLNQADPRRHAILNHIDAALRALDRRGEPGEGPGISGSMVAAETIAASIYKLVDTEVMPTITAVGHTHLDVGWLWRVTHTRDKTGRSFATVLNLMAEYPGFVFMYNQAVLFDFLKTDYPEIWAGVVEAVKRGQFEIEGAMWVEPDANIVSGESMVRQMLFGRRFHRDNFGARPRCVWLPDTFGYSANMPQLLARSGLDFFITSKLSWNDTDRHPYDSFFWRGIDGTETKAQLITTQRFESEAVYTTYNSDLSVSEVMGAWRRFEPKRVQSDLLICYGYGDGGGGPTRGMIERARRLERGIPGAPKLRMEGLSPYLARIDAQMKANPDHYPRWYGELYLQYHRGTLTNIARNKRNNRLAERAMRELELASALAHALQGHPYPTEEIDGLWKTVLINQFHDILPGTSIGSVYTDSDAEYAALFAAIEAGNGPLQSALSAIAPKGTAAVVNFTGRARIGDLVELPSDAAGKSISAGGKVAPVQAITRPDGSTRHVAAVDVPALGWTALALADAASPTPSTLDVSSEKLENAHVRVLFDAKGEITSVFDKTTGRELLKSGQTGNRLVAYEDKSMDYDAWDIDWYFEEQFWTLAEEAEVSIEVVETGPLRAALRIERKWRASKIVQIVSLRAGARQVEFDTHADWQERQLVLKAEFALDLNVSELRSEIQFGHVTRPTHRNTSWDRARFEASMHRWIDMSEPDFGAALLNDCKYGYDAKEQTIRLTLLRGANYPFPDGDRGEHHFAYALFVHAGTSDLETVHHAAESFNNPLRLVGTLGPGNASESFSFASVDAPNVTLETLKKAEDGSGLVLRIFEHANRRAETTISFGMPVKSVRPVNLMEEDALEPLVVTDNAVHLSLRPFEITTLLIEL